MSKAPTSSAAPENHRQHQPPEHHHVVVIGGGQAGLSISWHLRQSGVDHIVLERSGIAHEWREGRWDNFTLVTPNWQCQLPGYSYEGDDPDGFMPRDLVHTFVRTYADSFGAPVREGQEVLTLRHLPGPDGRDDGFALTVQLHPGGERVEMTADKVVIATGGYHLPVIPAAAQRLPDRLRQIHSSQYRNSGDLPDGGVLVVGSGQSGAQIAEDLHLEGRKVTLAVGSAPRVARFYRGRDCVAWLADMGHYDRPVEEHPEGLATRDKTNHYVTGRDGGRDIDLRAFSLQGMELYGRLLDIRNEQLSFAPSLGGCLDAADRVAEGIKDAIDRHIAQHHLNAPVEERYTPVWAPETERTELDLAAAGINSVIWSIGYRADYRWVQIGVFDGQGHPRHVRGVTGVDGLYFLGLPWLHTWGSGRFAGIARDAGYLAEQIVGHPATAPEGAGTRDRVSKGRTREHALL
ncbi:putative flavoprotein involved in K+ transport [Nakamurella sp. UYEF19]|uniref:MSMEG_0569 family flavin-dependent oxidoreductase n=1 Tax=Nakamurella sp. UYEF19 TaxID=1756392 RepID=UPI00339724CD